MATLYWSDILYALQEGNFLWIIIPIFFIGVLTDKYQEEFSTTAGNAISNGALIIFTGFSWLQMIYGKEFYPFDLLVSQTIFSFLIIVYGFAIISSGLKNGSFARVYGRIRVITFMLMFFTIMIYSPILYNFVSILTFVFLFPFYYAFITELLKVMPNVSGNKNTTVISEKELAPTNISFMISGEKLKEYLR